jgi:hypothetical protein
MRVAAHVIMPLQPPSPKPADDDDARHVGTPPVAPGAPTAPRGRDLPLPHERDESIDLEGEVGHEVIEQAKRDLDTGQVDTDLRQTPGLDAERRERLLRRR